jgi:hypothetical protein
MVPYTAMAKKIINFRFIVLSILNIGSTDSVLISFIFLLVGPDSDEYTQTKICVHQGFGRQLEKKVNQCSSKRIRFPDVPN